MFTKPNKGYKVFFSKTLSDQICIEKLRKKWNVRSLFVTSLSDNGTRENDSVVEPRALRESVN